MESEMRYISAKRRVLYRKFAIGYLCLLGIPLMILALSIRKGAVGSGLFLAYRFI
ncbi:protein of unknown function [Burkholderia multivorans]